MLARSLAIAASVALFSQVANAANKCVREYTVKAGDICDSISAANNVSTYQLAALNPGTINADCTNLQIGSTLCAGSEGEDCATTYVVKLGDTCEGIYNAGQINGTIFGLNNPQVNADCTNIYVGEVLCVAPTVLVPPAPGVPIHTAPATSVTLANPTATPASTSSKVEEAVETPAVTPAPVAAAPTSSKAASAKPTGTDADEEEDCDEYEVVEGDTDEDLPFCDELY